MLRKHKISLMISFLLIISVINFGGVPLVNGESEEANSNPTKGRLIVRLYGSDYGLYGFGRQTDLLGVTINKNSSINLSNIATSKEIKLSIDSIKRVTMSGFIKPELPEGVDEGAKEVYSFTTNNNDGDVKVWINDKLVINKGKRHDIALTQGELAKLYIEYDVNDNPILALKWKKASDSDYRIITSKFCYSETVSTGKTFGSPLGDDDGDGIPNGWEINGYTVINGVVVPYDESLFTLSIDSKTKKEIKITDFPKYVTDYTKASSDGDPYSDFEEATGIGLEQSIIEPGNHPLVPSYPLIEFTISNVEIVRNITTTTGKVDSKSISLSSQTSNEQTSISGSGNSSSGHFNQSIEIGVKVDVEAGASLSSGAKFGAFVKSDSIGGFSNSSYTAAQNSIGGLRSNLKTEKSSDTYTEEELVDYREYATLKIRGYYTNNGTAPVYDMRPTLTVAIGTGNTKDVIKTLKFPAELSPSVLAPKLRYPESGDITYSTTTTGEGVLASPIYLTKAETEKILSGAPISVYITGYEGNVKPAGEGTTQEKDWKKYIANIDRLNTVVRYQIPGYSPLVRSIRVPTGSENDGFKEKITLMDALKILYNGEIDEEGNLSINGETIPREGTERTWQILVNTGDNAYAEALKELLKNNNGTTTGLALDEIVLKPNMVVSVRKKDSEEVPTVFNAFYDPSTSKLKANIFPGTEGIDSVKATIRTVGNNADQEIALTKSDDEPYLYESEAVYNINHEYGNKLVAIAGNEKQTEVDLYVDARYIKKSATVPGMGIVPIDWNINALKNPENRDAVLAKINENPDYDYFVVKVASSQRRHTFGYDTLIKDYSMKFGDESIYPDTDGILEIPNSELKEYRVKATPWTYENFEWDYPLMTTTKSQLSRLVVKGSSQEYDFKPRFPSKIHYPSFGFKMEFGGGNGVRTLNIFPTNRTRYSPQNEHYYGIGLKRTYNGFEYGIIRVFSILTKGDNQSPNKHDVEVIVSREDLLATINEWEFKNLQVRPVLTITGALNNNFVFIPQILNKNYSTLSATGQIPVEVPEATTAIVSYRTLPGVNKVKFSTDRYMEMSSTDVNGVPYNNIHEEWTLEKVENGKITITTNNDISYKIIGYFMDKEEAIQLDEIPDYWNFRLTDQKIQQSIIPDVNSGETDKHWTIPFDRINVDGYPVKPEMYLIKVTQEKHGSSAMRFRINDELFYMDTGSRTHKSYIQKNHTAYFYVPAKVGAPYNLNIHMDNTNEHDNTLPNGGESQIEKFMDVGYINLEVIGYFTATK